MFSTFRFLKKNIYLFIFGCVGSSFLCKGFLQLQQVGATLHRGARACHYRGLFCCRAQAPDAQAQQLWLTGLVAPWHVGSSQTRARTRVPCISRQISQPLRHQGSPSYLLNQQFILIFCRFGLYGIDFPSQCANASCSIYSHQLLDHQLPLNSFACIGSN